ncbi:cobyrinate a,c-diamide synthase [Halorubrum sp. JWXQ-INN 858]|uniref:cobyrinate a,c-diamide synthase n=1 Tax=Halorubrum sp. JWXQ-INN 858 TaxID=2690782 RepID=UPI0013FBA203|nr:cobyrinate a,c-diamide synthase [Halorubrum sp. JWXQ-INN 858]MWV64909.1 cobyrinate a,c-diamide synthase [Halorubrum sp. JWXQ-INN 858]
MTGIVVGGTASGVGKTVATLAIARALSSAGYRPVPAKAGPDYIDPSHHAAAIGRPSRTLDTWMQGVDGVRRNLHRAVTDDGSDSADSGPSIAVVEGMMGLYDGSVTSTAATAAALDVPVVLVVDASAGMQSVGATALGFREYAAHVALPDAIHEAVAEPRVDVVGVVAARAHGGRHAAGIRESLPEGIAWLGRVPPMDGLEIPDRHLGLHMGDEAPIPEAAIDEAAAALDGEALARVARPVATPEGVDAANANPANANSTNGDTDRPTVAVATDAAFRFVYPATRERLRELATVVTFAPVAGDDLPACDAVYLPGGYPENHAAALSSSPALSTLASRAADGLPVLGECGGLMALSQSLTTVDGETYGMAGVLPGDVVMQERYQALDHVELRAVDDGVTARAEERHRGHEFHYSAQTLDPDDDARFAFAVERGTGIDGDRDGLREHRTVGTYAHRHAECGAFDRLVAAAHDYARGR